MSQKRKRSRSNSMSRRQSARLSRVVFLGTSSAQPIPLKRNVSSLVIQTTSGSLSMVDCGEGTQHQFKLSTLKIGKLRNIFITHLHGDHCYGLFGLLHSIRNEEDNDFTLNIYGPKGIKQMIRTTLHLSGGLYHYKLNIVELQLESERRDNKTSHKREKHKIQRNDTVDSSRMDMSCNEETDEEEIIMMSSDSADDSNSHHEMENESTVSNTNAEEVHFNPFSTNDVIDLGEIEPGIKCVACRLTHRIETFGYVFIEDNQPGKLDAAKAIALGAKGKLLGMLKNGKDVTLDNGTTIYSKDVVGEQIIGNKVGVMQDCSDCRSCFEVAQQCDLFIHECTYDEEHKEQAVPRGHSTAKMAALNAVKVNAKMLMLTHFSSRFVEEGCGHHAEDANENSNNKENTDVVELKENEEVEAQEDLMHVQRLQKEAEEEVEKYKSTCLVRCAADFMSVRFGKNKQILIDKELAISDSKKQHFLHDLPYLKLVANQAK